MNIWHKLKQHIMIKLGLVRTHEKVDWMNLQRDIDIQPFFDSLPLLSRLVLEQIWDSITNFRRSDSNVLFHFKKTYFATYNNATAFTNDSPEYDRYINKFHIAMERNYHFWTYLLKQDVDFWQTFEEQLQQAFQHINNQFVSIDNHIHPINTVLSLNHEASIDIDFQTDRLYIPKDDDALCSVAYCFIINNIKIKVLFTYHLFNHKIESKILLFDNALGSSSIWQEHPLGQQYKLVYKISKKHKPVFEPLLANLSNIDKQVSLFYGNYEFHYAQELEDWITIFLQKCASMFGANACALSDLFNDNEQKKWRNLIKDLLLGVDDDFIDNDNNFNFASPIVGQLVTPSLSSNFQTCLQQVYWSNPFRHNLLEKLCDTWSYSQNTFENIGLWNDILFHCFAIMNFENPKTKRQYGLLFYYNFNAHFVGFVTLKNKYTELLPQYVFK